MKPNPSVHLTKEISTMKTYLSFIILFVVKDYEVTYLASFFFFLFFWLETISLNDKYEEGQTIFPICTINDQKVSLPVINPRCNYFFHWFEIECLKRFSAQICFNFFLPLVLNNSYRILVSLLCHFQKVIFPTCLINLIMPFVWAW